MLQDMEKRLQEEGLDPSASINERLSLLWQLYKSSESTVKSLNKQIQDLQKERVAEIEKVSWSKEKILLIIYSPVFVSDPYECLWNTKRYV